MPEMILTWICGICWTSICLWKPLAKITPVLFRGCRFTVQVPSLKPCCPLEERWTCQPELGSRHGAGMLTSPLSGGVLDPPRENPTWPPPWYQLSFTSPCLYLCKPKWCRCSLVSWETTAKSDLCWFGIHLEIDDILKSILGIRVHTLHLWAACKTSLRLPLR